MRIFLRCVAALLLLATATFSRADAPAPAMVAVPDVFSYQMPPGWSQINLPGTTYPAAVEGPHQAGPGDVKAMISVNTDLASMPLTEWCTKAMAKNKAQFAELKARVGELEGFVTASGAPGFRATVDLYARGRPLHYVMYFFDGGGETKVAVTCACPAAEVARYAPLFEAAMKTFVPR